MKKRNFVRLVFCEPVIRALYPDRDRVAQPTLAQLRMAPVTRKTHGWPNCRTGQAQRRAVPGTEATSRARAT
ncbi:hypothetical protein ACFYSJ_38755 [Streptomyces sp. NPDC005248]|uniref:MmyB family transcriptional regulator n=1 Tax=Streptomyces sp. NPDC005248 TaxID=3364709 RepID=UPI0036A4C590